MKLRVMGIGIAGMVAASVAAVVSLNAETSAAASTPDQLPVSWPHAAPASVVPHLLAKAHAETQASGGQEIDLYTEGRGHHTVDLNGNGKFDPGDYVVFAQGLRDQDTGQLVGRANFRCMQDVTDYSTCDGTIQLFHRGKLTIQGSTFTFNDDRYPITGGTARFVGASGEMMTTEVGLLILEVDH